MPPRWSHVTGKARDKVSPVTIATQLSTIDVSFEKSFACVPQLVFRAQVRQETGKSPKTFSIYQSLLRGFICAVDRFSSFKVRQDFAGLRCPECKSQEANLHA